MVWPVLVDPQEVIYISSEQTKDVVFEDLPGAMDDWDGWRERESGKSTLSA